jgi:intracellular septation protein
MKIFFDLFPILLFFIVFKTAGIYAATATAIAATVAQIAWTKWRHGKVDTMLWISFAIITVLGGATLLLHNESFIKWKPTVLYWAFASSLLLSPVLFKKNLIRAFMHEKMPLPEHLWGKVNAAWGLFFAALGGINLYVAFNYSLDTWVNFKLFGTTSMMLIFILAQAALLSKHIKTED